MDFAQIKSKIPSFPASLSGLSANMDFVRDIDMKALAIGLGLVATSYACLYFYVSSNAQDTIKAIESRLAYETVSVTSMKAKQEKNERPAASKQVIEGLYQNTASGYLPIIRRNDNLTSFRAYQRPFSFENVDLTKPVVSFIVVDFGLSKDQSLKSMDILPPEVSFVLSPYASLPEEWVSMAREKGHEVWLNQPIQQENAIDLGNYMIFHHASYNDKLKSLFSTLAITQGYLGISSYTDKTLDYAAEDYSKLAEEVYTRGLGYLETNPNAPKTIEGKSITFGAPYIQADMELLRTKGEQSFDDLEHIAQKQGHVVVVVPNASKVVKNLAVWIMKIAQADYTLAPASAMFDLPLYQASHNVKHDNNAIMTETPTELKTNDHDMLEDTTHHDTGHEQHH